MQNPYAPDPDSRMKTEFYDLPKEHNKMSGLHEVSISGQDIRKNNPDYNINLGSPIPKHRRQQQLQENIPAARGGINESICNTQSIPLM
jgi:hypothetical protein